MSGTLQAGRIADREVALMETLFAAGRAPEIPESADVYGWLVGGWDLDILTYWKDVSALGLKGEAHFAWVLEGRAVQDVWIMPRRSDRGGTYEHGVNSYGTTLRVWDAALQAWRVTWINPAQGARTELIGRRVGQRHRADRAPRGRHAHPLDVHRHHEGLVPLDRRGARHGRQDLEAAGRLPRTTAALTSRFSPAE